MCPAICGNQFCFGVSIGSRLKSLFCNALFLISICARRCCSSETFVGRIHVYAYLGEALFIGVFNVCGYSIPSIRESAPVKKMTNWHKRYTFGIILFSTSRKTEPMDRGVHPPEAMMHFPLFQIPPISEKFLRLCRKFSPKKFRFSSAKIPDDLFLVIDHKFDFVSPILWS